MATSDNDELHRKLAELNEQTAALADILEILIQKMTRVEEATAEISREMREEIEELKDELDIDKDGDT